MHASTSPFYPLFASLDVGAQMMKGRQGEVLWDDTIRLGIELRKKLRAIAQEFEEKEADPDAALVLRSVRAGRGRVTRTAMTKWEDVPTDELASDPRYWQLTPGAAWHGFRHVTPGYAMTDPEQADPADAGLRPR